jgi:uncharacterized membrane protein (DUF485 family)
VPTSVTEILTGASSIRTSTGAGSVELPALSPMTNYSVYCVSMNAASQYSSFADALKNRIYVVTLCCKPITAKLAIGSVTNATRVVNAVTVTVGALPSKWMSVSVVVTGGRALHPVFYPLSQNLTSLSSAMSVSFDLVSTKALGNVTVTIKMSGPSTMEFGTSSLVQLTPISTFRVIGSTQEPDVPVLYSSAFATNGLSVIATFSSATNKGSMPASWFACSNLFTFSGASASQCQWSADARSVTIKLPAVSTLAVSDSITSLAGVVKAQCPASVSSSVCSGWSAATSVAVSIGPPATPVVPLVSINAPTAINSCDGLLMDLTGSTGSCGRAWTQMSFEIGSSDPNVTGIEEYFNNHFQLYPPTPLPATLFTASYSYVITVKLCNFFGYCGTKSLSLEVMSEPVISLAIVGPLYQSIARSASYAVGVNSSVSSCGLLSSRYQPSFSWSLFDLQSGSSVSVTSTSKDPSKLVLSSYSLSSVHTYSVTVQASVSLGTTTLSATTSSQVYVVQGSLVAVIAGGSYQGVREGSTAPLDGSGSYDQDQFNHGAVGLTFAWSCLTVLPSFSETCAFVVNSGSQSSSVLSITSRGTASTVSEFTLTVSDVSGRQDDAVAEVAIISPLSPLISLATQVVGPTVFWNTVIFSSSVVFPRGQSGLCQWESSEASMNVRNISLTPAIVRFESSSATPLHSSLVLPPFALPSGASLTFSLTCMLDVDSTAASAMSISVVTVSTPTPGVLVVSPLTGTELQTVFSFSAARWEDDYLPLQYVFGYINPVTDQFSAMVPKSYATFISTSLAAGDPTNEYYLSCYLSVFNSYQANTTLFESLKVSVTALSADEVSSRLATSLNASLSVSEITQAVTLYGGVLNRVNCSGSLDCAALNREACTSVTDTCGSCLASFFGVAGPSNDLCVSPAMLLNASSTLGAFCIDDAQCYSELQSCSTSSNTCIPKDKYCSDEGTCSGNGLCFFTNVITGSEVSSCATGSADCTVSCSCSVGFVGSSCQFTPVDIESMQSNRELLMRGLVQLPGIQDVDSFSLSYWSNGASSLTQNAVEVSSATSSNALAVVGVILVQSYSYNESLPAVTIGNLVTTLDSIVSAGVSGAINGSAINSLVSSYISQVSTHVTSTMVAGQSSASIIASNFRASSAVQSVGQESVLTVPLTTAESVMGIASSSMSVLSRSMNASSSESFSLIQLKESVFGVPNVTSLSMYRSVNRTASPLRVQFAGSSFCSNDKTDGNQYDFVFTLQHLESQSYVSEESVVAHARASRQQIVAECRAGFGGNFSVLCDGDGTSANVTYHCDGIWDYNVTLTCPAVIRYVVPVCALTFNGYSLPASACTVLNSSDWSTQCGCEICGNILDPTQRHRQLSTQGTGHDVVDVVAASILVSSMDFADVITDPSALTSANDFFYVVRVISVFATLWLGLPMLWAASSMFRKAQFRTEVSKSHRRASVGNFMQEPTRLNASKVLLDYANGILPVMFAEKTVFSRCWEVLTEKVPFFIVIFGESKRFKAYHVPVILFKVLTTLTYGLFALSFFFSVQYPSDTGFCNGFVDEMTCVGHKTPLDQSLSTCMWRNATATETSGIDVGAGCVQSTPQYDAYMNIIMCILVVLATTPILFILERLFNDILLAPTSSELEGEVAEAKSAVNEAMKKVAGTVRRVSVNIATQVQNAVASTASKRRQSYGVMEPNIMLPRELIRHRATAVQACGDMPIFRKLADNISSSMKCDRAAGKNAVENDPIKAEGEVIGPVPVVRPSSKERSVARRRAMEDSWKDFLVDLKQCRSQLHRPRDLEKFDQAWGVELVTDEGAVMLSTASRDTLRKEFVHAQSKGHRALSSLKKMPRSMCGAEMMKLLFLDMIGSSSVHAKILKESVNEAVLHKKRVVTWSMKCIVIAGLILVNLFFVYMCMLYAANRNTHWQGAWVTNATINIAIELIVGPILEAFVLDCIIPGTISKAVERAKIEVARQVKRLCERKSNSLTDRSFPDLQSKYFFSSRVVANKRPDLMESSLVHGFETPFPFINEHIIKRIAENRDRSAQDAANRTTRSWVVNSVALTTLLAHWIRYLGTAPGSVQRFVMQVMQPVLIGVFGFGFSVLEQHMGLAWTVLLLVVSMALFIGLLVYIIQRLLRKPAELLSVTPEQLEDLSMFKSFSQQHQHDLASTDASSRPAKLKKRRLRSRTHSHSRGRFDSGVSVDSSADYDPHSVSSADSPRQRSVSVSSSAAVARNRTRTVSENSESDGAGVRKRTSSAHARQQRLRQRQISFDSEASDISPRRSSEDQEANRSPRTCEFASSSSPNNTPRTLLPLHPHAQDAKNKRRGISFDVEEDYYRAAAKGGDGKATKKTRAISFDTDDIEEDLDMVPVRHYERHLHLSRSREEMKMAPIDDLASENDDNDDDEIELGPTEREVAIGVDSDSEGELEFDSDSDNDEAEAVDNEARDKANELFDTYGAAGFTEDFFAAHNHVNFEDEDLSSSSGDSDVSLYDDI